jgi:hypothetical protein
MRLLVFIVFGLISSHTWGLSCADPLLQGTGSARCAQQCLRLGAACTGASVKAISTVAPTTPPLVGEASIPVQSIRPRFARVTQQAAAPLPPPPPQLDAEDLNPVTGVLTPWQANAPVPVVVAPEAHPQPPPTPTVPAPIAQGAPPMVQPVFIVLAPWPLPPPRHRSVPQRSPLPPISSTETVSTAGLQLAALQSATSVAISPLAVSTTSAAATLPPKLANSLPSQPVSLTTRADDDLLLLAVSLNGRPLLNSLDAYLSDDVTQAWVPLGRLLDALNFPITVDVAGAQAHGWFISETTTFHLNMGNQTLEIAGKAQPYPAGSIARHADDLYVQSSLLAAWFPFEVGFNFQRLQLALTSTQTLPGQARREREANWQQLAKAQQRQNQQAAAEAIPLPYQLFSQPSLRLDAGINSSYANANGVRTNGTLGVQAEGEALYGTGQLAVQLQRESSGGLKLGESSLLVERNDLTPRHFAGVPVTNLGAGDITAPQLALSQGSTSGRGVRVSNRGQNPVDDPDRFVLEGTAPVGWDVEVYQDQSLIAFQRITGDGRYRFNALPLRAGLNLFRIVQLGPQGEKRESFERYHLGQEMPNMGEVQYDTAFYQPGQRTLGLGQTNANSSQPDAPWQLRQRLDLGLTNNLALSLGAFGVAPFEGNGQGAATSSTTQANRLQGFTAGLRGTAGPLYLTADAMQNEQDQTAYGFSGRSNLWEGADLRLGYLTRQGPRLPGDDDLINSYNATLNTNVTLVGLGLSNGLTYQVNELSGTSLANPHTTEQSLNYRFGTNMQGLALSHQLDYTWGEQTPRWQGEAEVAGNVQHVRWRAKMAYQPDDLKAFQRFSLNTQMPLADTVSMDNTLTYNNSTATNTQLASQIRYNLGTYALGLTGQTDTQGDVGLGLTLSTMLLPQPNGAYRAVHPSYGTGLGRVQVLVFVDDNGNAVHDEGEDGLPGVQVRNRSRGTTHPTNNQGVAVVDNLPSYTPVKLSVDEDSLQDIFLKPTKPLVTLSSHPGASGAITLPVRRYGEVLGTAVVVSTTARNETTTVPLGKQILELVNQAGEVTDSVTTDADGYFAIAPVPLGAYYLRPTAGSGYSMSYTSNSYPINLTKRENSLDLGEVTLVKETP